MRTALVVDDSRSIRLHLRERLVQLGFDEVLEAATGEEGLRLLAARRPDVVFLDLVLPDVSGATFAREVLEEAPRTRIVLVTANAREHEDVVRSFAAGVREYLRKPVADADLASVVERVTRG